MADDVLQRSASEMLETLEQVENRLQELKAERERLYEANQALVELVEHLEDELSAYVDTATLGDISVQGYEYSFTDGWKSKADGHEDRLEMEPDVDVSGVEDQIREVRNSIKRYDR